MAAARFLVAQLRIVEGEFGGLGTGLVRDLDPRLVRRDTPALGRQLEMACLGQTIKTSHLSYTEPVHRGQLRLRTALLESHRRHSPFATARPLKATQAVRLRFVDPPASLITLRAAFIPFSIPSAVGRISSTR